MVYTSKIYDEYARLCTGRLTEPTIRKIVMMKTKGWCPASKFVQADGTPWSTKELCENTGAYVKKTTWFKEKDLDTHVGKLVAHEGSVQPARLSKDMEELLDTLSKGVSLATFRRELMSSAQFKVSALHFFHWDGTCRSETEIKRALRAYPRSAGGIFKIMGAVLGAVAVAGVGAALYKRSRLRSIPDIDTDQMHQNMPRNSSDEEDDYLDQDIANLQNDNKRIDVDNALIDDEIEINTPSRHRIRVKSVEELERVLQYNVDWYVTQLSQHPILTYRGRSPDEKFWKRYVEGRPVGAMHLLELDGVTLDRRVSRSEVAVVYRNRIVVPFLALRMQGRLPGILTPGEAKSIYRRLIAIHRERL